VDDCCDLKPKGIKPSGLGDNVETINVKAFFLSVIFLAAGGYLAFDMQDDITWMTYSSDDTEEYFDGDFWWAVEVTNMNDYGLQEATISANGKMCDDRDCYPIDMSSEFEILDHPILLEERGGPVDCDTTKEDDDILICEIASAGSSADAIISTGLGFLGLTLILSLVGVFGYIPGSVLKLLSLISSVILFSGPIVWYVLMPDMNADISATEERYRLSRGFFLTLLSSPLVFVAGRFCGTMEAFAYQEEEDWDEEDDYFMNDDEYASYSDSYDRPIGSVIISKGSISIDLQGVLDEEGYEWVEHPEGSEEWYWRNQDTGEWVRH
tara:strand:- start:6653 stop:7624 length:972 start_codon:yes stop_codon:yes gene_type:complete